MGDVELTEWGWAQFWAKAKALLLAHHREVSRGAFAPDTMLAQRLADAGALKVYVALSGGLLIGYSIWYLSDDLERAGKLVASQGPWFVEPTRRGGGVGEELMRYSLEHLRLLGAARALPHFWGPDRGLGEWFTTKLGARLLETVYEIDLVEESL